MKILLTSDTHIGLTQPNSIRKMLKKSLKEEVDLIVHAGDYCGGYLGSKSVKSTVKVIRECYPDKPFLSVIGNHEHYHKHYKRNKYSFEENYESIKTTFLHHNVHFLDENGIYRYNNVVFAGHTGWYTNPNPPTNDKTHIGDYIAGQNCHQYLLKKAFDSLYDQIDELDKTLKDNETIVFVSHFPVVKDGPDYKGNFEDFSWSENISQIFIKGYNCKYFIEGHSHSRHEGPLKYNCGSDYGNPKYQIVEIE